MENPLEGQISLLSYPRDAYHTGPFANEMAVHINGSREHGQ